MLPGRFLSLSVTGALFPEVVEQCLAPLKSGGVPCLHLQHIQRHYLPGNPFYTLTLARPYACPSEKVPERKRWRTIPN